jgi:hypothetical protein
MVISDDRWTCPDCGRTFSVEDAFGRAGRRLAALRAMHAAEHLGSAGGPRGSADRPRKAGSGHVVAPTG